MIQQINLYQKDLVQSQSTSLAYKILSCLIIALILLFAYSIYIYVHLSDTQKHIHATSQQLIEAETRVKLLQVKYPKQHINALITHELSRSNDKLASLSDILRLLKDKNSDQNRGFSSYFSALARQSVNNAWLSNITIDGVQQTLTLHGSSLQAKSIPLLIQKLRNETIFQGTRFEKLTINQDPDNDQQINFTVSTNVELEEDE